MINVILSREIIRKIPCKARVESRITSRTFGCFQPWNNVTYFVLILSFFRVFRARWRENRTIFNTPNPRLMNVSLLRDSKLLHGQERRGSRISVRMPSRQPSMTSLRPHSPNPSLGKQGLYSPISSHYTCTDFKYIGIVFNFIKVAKFYFIFFFYYLYTLSDWWYLVFSFLSCFLILYN